MSESRGAGLVRVVAAELTKVGTSRAVLLTIAAVLVLPPTLAVAMGLNLRGASAVTTAASAGFEVAGFGQPLVVLLAAMIVGGEYRDGLLRSSQLATPNRARLFGAQCLVVTALSGGLAVVSIGTAVLLRHGVLGLADVPVSGLTPALAGNLFAVALNWTLMGLISAAVTVLARSVLVPVVVLVPLVLGLGIALVGVLPWLRFAPDLAGLQLISPVPGLGLLDPVAGALVMATWATVLLGAAQAVFSHRDL
jgi:ABC-2 type transport system permease protein